MLTLSHITQAIAATTGTPVKRALRPTDKLTDLGLDSLDAMEIALHIEVALETETPTNAETTWVTVQDVLDTYNQP